LEIFASAFGGALVEVFIQPELFKKNKLEWTGMMILTFVPFGKAAQLLKVVGSKAGEITVISSATEKLLHSIPVLRGSVYTIKTIDVVSGLPVKIWDLRNGVREWTQRGRDGESYIIAYLKGLNPSHRFMEMPKNYTTIDALKAGVVTRGMAQTSPGRTSSRRN
jgi:hypothetical protein